MPLELKTEPHHALTYGNNVMMVAQQLNNPFRAAVTEAPCKGEAVAAADLVGSIEYLESQGRARTNPENVPQNDRRWLVYPTEIESGQYIEKEDTFQMIYDPTSVLVRTHTAAVNRGIADRILGVKKEGSAFTITGGGIFGVANVGKRPGNTVALPAGNTIPHASTGLTTAKLIDVREAMGLADFGLEDDDPIYCAITPRQVSDLLDVAAKADSSIPAYQIEQLRTGEPTTLLGINWIVTNRLPKSGSNRLCPVWTKRNIVLGLWQDIRGDMWDDTHAKKKPYVHVGAFIDCVRVEDAGVRVIECVEP